MPLLFSLFCTSHQSLIFQSTMSGKNSKKVFLLFYSSFSGCLPKSARLAAASAAAVNGYLLFFISRYWFRF